MADHTINPKRITATAGKHRAKYTPDELKQRRFKRRNPNPWREMDMAERLALIEKQSAFKAKERAKAVAAVIRPEP